MKNINKVFVVVLLSIVAIGSGFAILIHKSSASNGKDAPELSYNTVTKVLDNGERETAFHGKWVNYMDEGGKWQTIDPNFTKTTRGFEMTKAPFEVVAPFYSDEVATFNNNNRYDIFTKKIIYDKPLAQSIQALGVAHVEGKTETGDLGWGSVEYVVYPNAYPEYKADLIYWVYQGKAPELRKFIRFNEKLTKDTDFKFKVNYSDPVETVNNGKNVTVKLKDATAERGNGWANFYIWDSSGGWDSREPINFDFQKPTIQSDPNEYILTKHIKADYFSNATLPVFTDATSTFYPNPHTEVTSVDGYASDANNTGDGIPWTNVRAEPGESGADDASTIYVGVKGGYIANQYEVLSRGIMLFDVSSIPGTATVTAANLVVTVESKYADGNTAWNWNIAGSSPASNTAVAFTDYASSHYVFTQYSTPISYATFTAGNAYTYALNASGLARIIPGGIAKFALLMNEDIMGSGNPNEGGRLHTRVNFYASEQAGTTQDPTLVVTYTAPVVADRYWVGGTGNWSSTAHWSTSSGGASGASVPTSTQSVAFDTNSSGASYTVTIDSAAVVGDITWGNPSSGIVTWGGSYPTPMSIYGSLTMAPGMNITYNGTITFAATSGAKTITSNGVAFVGNLIIGATGTATFTLQDNLNLNGSYALNYGGGTFVANGKAVNYTSSVIQIGGSFAGSSAFYDLILTGNASKTAAATFGSDCTWAVTHNLTINGNSTTNRLWVKSNSLGTARTITATGASVNYSNVDFQDITISGGTLGTNVSVGNAGGNTGITFTPAFTQHWITAAGGNWSNAANWTGNSPRVPLPQDDVQMDYTFGTSATVVADMPRLGKSIDWTMATWTTGLTWNLPADASSYGSLTLISGLTTSGSNYTLTLNGRGSYTLRSNGVPIAFMLGVSMFGGTLTLQDALNNTNINVIQLSAGTFNANNFAVTTAGINGNAGTSTVARSITMGSGQWTLTGSGSIWAAGTATVTANTSTIKITDTSNNAVTFVGGSRTYNNVWFSRGASTGSITVSGSNTFADFKDTGTAAHSIIFGAGTTQTVSTFSVSGTAGNLITLNSSSTGTFTLTKSGGGTINVDYVNIQHSVATPASTWTAGLNSVNNQAVATAGSGWTFTTPARYVRVLVVGGGGGGAAMTGGGGGAGGLLYDAVHAVPQSSYTVTVGSGGAGQVGSADPGNGSDGGNSIFDNLIAVGGGGAGTNSGTGRLGGSGGGAGHNNTTGGSGTSGQGNSGSGGNTTSPNYGAGGGGGAGASGGVPTNTTGGNGGVGLAYSISGSSVYYAGGGGGGTYMGGTPGVGGNGGGGSAPAGNATPNTGGGGGGQINNLANGGNGGSGVVIISYPTDGSAGINPASTTGGTKTTSGANTIHTFTSSGTFVINSVVADRYWVGGSGNWSDTAHWSTSSGGTGGASVPTSTQSVSFDINSASANYTVTIDTTANCADMAWANPSSGKPTLAGGSPNALNIYGNLTLVSGMNWTFTWYLNFKATSGTKLITTAGVSIPSIFTIAGAGGTFQLGDDFTSTVGSNGISRTAGTFNPNGKTFTISGSSRIQGFNGTSSFYNLNIVGPAVAYSGLYLYDALGVNGTLTISGNSITNRMLIYSSTIGTARTITANAVSLSNVDFQDITGAGAATWSGTSIGNALGNTGITFTTPVTRYWVAASGGNWSSTSSWSATSGGSSGASVPLLQDTVIFDSNSITSTGKTITMDIPRVPSVDFSNVLNAPAVTVSSAVGGLLYSVGSINLTGVGTYSSGSNANAFWGRGTSTLTSNGKTLYGLYPYNFGGILNIVGDLTLTGAFIGSVSGTVNAGTNSLITLTGAGTAWSHSSVCTFVANGSTIKFTDTTNTGLNFYGSTGTYNNVWFSRGASTGNIAIYGSNTFNDFKDTGTSAHSIIFKSGTTQTVATFTVSGTAGNLITLNSDTTGTHTLTKSGGGTINVDYVNIQHSIATPASTWTAGQHSIDNQGVATAGSGWTFIGPPPAITSYSNLTDGALDYSASCTTCGVRIGGPESFQTITITGTNFGTDPGAGNRSTSANNIKVGTKQISSSNVVFWSATSIRFTTDTSLVGDSDTDWGTNFGGSNALTVTAGSQTTSGLNFYVFPQITSTTAASLFADTAREYSASDTDGVLTLNGTRFGTAQGSGGVELLGYNATVVSWSNTAITVQVPVAIPDNVYTGSVVMTQGAGGNSLTHTYSIPLRILPRITSISPSTGSTGDTIQINGNHFCQDGTCPASGSRSTASNKVVFATTQATENDFESLTGGAGNCNGTGTAWTYKEICVQVPQGAITGNIQLSSSGFSAYASNTVSFTVGSSGSLQEVSGAVAQAGNKQVFLRWVNPSSPNLRSILVLRRALVAPTEIPVDGTTYGTGYALGLSTVACVVNSPATSCIDRGLVNGQAYYYRIFTRGANGNYSTF
ncbi:MAG: hypothetical protein PHS95_01305 [Candidatus Pacebacteria bacterium]|nr:hypothetical protein [Candidatus Paceibacterota bacterium]